MKIAIVISSLAKGGAENVVAMLSREWSKEHEVSLLLFEGQKIAYPYGGRLLNLNTPVKKSIFGKMANVIRRIIKLNRFFKIELPDRIFAFQESAGFPTTIAAFLAGQAGQVTVSIRNNPMKLSLNHKITILFIYRLAAFISINSEIGRQFLIKKFNYQKRKVIFQGNPIDLKRIEILTKKDVPPLWDSNDPVLMSCGRLDRQKGFDILIQAFSEVRKSHNVNLVIFGEGPHRTDLENQLKQLGLENHVFLPGITENLFPYYKKATIFILSSRYEGWPNVLGEALAAGLPVISTNCLTGPSEILENGKYGKLVPVDDVNSIANAIIELLNKPEERKRLSDIGPQHIKKYGLEKIASLLLTCHRK